ncbi:hypothetical protein OXX59_010585, partial [Metschnikowia pulcherrima]
VVTKVVVYSWNASLEASLDGNNDVVVYNSPAELVVTSTTPDSVATEPSELVVTKVVVYSWNASLDASLDGNNNVGSIQQASRVGRHIDNTRFSSQQSRQSWWSQKW